MIAVEWKGWQSNVKQLEALGKGLAGKITRKATRAGAKVIQKESIRTCPIGSSKVLKKSIKVRAAKRKRGRIAYNVQTRVSDFPERTNKAPARTFHAGQKTRKPLRYYAAFLFYGSKTKSGKVRTKPNDWMKKAAETKQAESTEVFRQTMAAEIKKVVA